MTMQPSSAVAPDQDTGACFHCGLPIPAGLELTVDFDGAPRSLCCHGCQAVARTILDYGLDDYYRHRTAAAKTADEQSLLPEALRVYDDPRLQKNFVLPWATASVKPVLSSRILPARPACG
ncbi:MAG: heavy metal translocating P-type ATPase metal-binding domain-containing protein [Gammaproteobacteria bacterium]|nr:heavy metal translocating P-type ATPase metal-binding domain-containing protein [Gammaproteobacteria bacterium]